MVPSSIISLGYPVETIQATDRYDETCIHREIWWNCHPNVI